jgi:hypothetical protein
MNKITESIVSESRNLPDGSDYIVVHPAEMKHEFPVVFLGAQVQQLWSNILYVILKLQRSLLL